MMNKNTLKESKSLHGSFNQKKSQGSSTNLEEKQDDLIHELVDKLSFYSKKTVATNDLQEEVDKLKVRNKQLASKIEGSVWLWQKDGGNNIESLSCDILISPNDLLSELESLKYRTLALINDVGLEEMRRSKQRMSHNDTSYVTCVGLHNSVQKNINLLENDCLVENHEYSKPSA